MTTASGACLDDATLGALAARTLREDARKRAVEHLEGCEQCQDVFALLQSDHAGTRDRIGRFVVVRELGRGATGVVYLGHDSKLDRKVAIKMLAHADERVAARFEREARALARLNHPNVVAVYEVGHQDDETFMAMEFVDGATLRGWLAASKRSRDEILDVFEQAAQGLLVAHRAGIVHRDFKPDNVLIGSDGRVRVVDFGLARRAERPDSLAMPAASASEPTRTVDATLTRTGALLGTPAYMAPEQYLLQEIDARADQFAFAIALAEALYGRRPFAGRSIDELAAATTSGRIDLPPDGARSEILRRALAVSPNDRFPSLAELLDALRSARSARPPIKPSRRGVLVIGAMSIVGAAVAGTLAIALRRDTAAADPAEAGTAAITPVVAEVGTSSASSVASSPPVPPPSTQVRDASAGVPPSRPGGRPPSSPRPAMSVGPNGAVLIK